jgi:hypothetical protein
LLGRAVLWVASSLPAMAAQAAKEVQERHLRGWELGYVAGGRMVDAQRYLRLAVFA